MLIRMPVIAKKISAAPAVDSPDRRRLPLLLRRAWYCLTRRFAGVSRISVEPDQFTVMRTLLGA